MVKEYKIVFTSFDSDIYDIEMMELEGMPLFFHSIKNLQNAKPGCHIIVEGKNHKIIDYCKQKGIETVSKEYILSSDVIVNAYKPFLYRQSKYSLIDQYRDLEVTDLQSYWFALYIVDRLKQYDLSEHQKKEKANTILLKQPTDEQICLIGDSLIEYWNVQEINNCKIFNIGIGDHTTAECLEWIVTKLQLGVFQIFFIIIGTNDLKYKVDKSTIVNNVICIIETIRKANNKATIIYSLVPNVYRRWDRRNDEIIQLNIALREAVGSKVLILDPSFLNNQYGELDCNNTIDGLHFNESAYDKIKIQLEKIIRDNE